MFSSEHSTPHHGIKLDICAVGFVEWVLALPTELRVQFAVRTGEMCHEVSVTNVTNVTFHCNPVAQVHCLLQRPALGAEAQLAVPHEQGGARHQLLQEQIHTSGK